MALYHHFTKPEDSDTVVPITRQVAIQLAEPPEGIDRSLWLYELCRFLTMKVNNLLIAFFAEDPPCSAQTCPEMRASEWQYLCAVHEPPKSCCAIDYCCHTLDWATNTLTSPKYFPSRLTLGSETAGGPQASMRHLTNIFRRLYRIFAHAWFQHRNVFWDVENNDGLYVFFKTVCDMFSLIPEDNYTIPPEAEGVDTTEPQLMEPIEGKRLTILRKEGGSPFGSLEGMGPSLDASTTTRRHKHSPSTGSHVGTITEAAEDNEDVAQASASLREVLKDSPEPRPESPVKAEIAAEEAVETPVESTEPAAAGQPTEEDPVDIAEETKNPEASSAEAKETAEQSVEQATEQPAEQPAEQSADENPEKDAEQSEERKVEESEETPAAETTEKFPESDDVTTESVNQEAKNEPDTETET